MRNLFLLSGVPGAGKTTFIRNNNLKYYTLTPDDIRPLFLSYISDQVGEFVIGYNSKEFSSHANRLLLAREKDVWEFVRKQTERKMKAGETIFIDATFVRRDYILPFVKLAKENRYRVFVVRFEVDLETLKERNRHRGVKNVDDAIVERMFVQFNNITYPSSITVLKPEDVLPLLEPQFFPLEGRNLFVIGDIHGCINPLREFVKEYYNREDVFIFLGDYIDRGPDSLAVLELLMELQENKNVVLLEGNHEVSLYTWALEGSVANVVSKETRRTIAKIENEVGDVEKFRKNLRKMFRRMFPCRTYLLKGKKFLFTHGGIPTIEKIGLLPAFQAIWGVGKYEDAEKVADVFASRHPDVIQFHGHRNVEDLPFRTAPNVFNLEGAVERGGELRVVKFDGRNFEFLSLESDYVYQTKDRPVMINAVWDKAKTDEQKVDLMKNSPFVKIKKQRAPFKNIISLNFSTTAFKKRIWDNITIHARGLFWDEEKKRITLRGYDKFFNYKENSYSDEKTIKNFSYPVKAWKKYNGFLLLVSYDSELNKVLYATKSVMFSAFVNIALRTMTDDEKDEIERLAKEFKGYTLVFEVCNPKEDPHIIEDKGIYLLDIVKNTLALELYPIEQVKTVYLKKKELMKILHSYEELKEFFKELDQRTDVEGVVITDMDGKPLLKYKTPYYLMWKRARKIMFTINKLGYAEPTIQGFEFPELIKITKWMNEHKDLVKTKNIIIIRNHYYSNKK